MAKATPAQLAQLPFRSGLTTRDSVSKVSGRGMGFDVVGASMAFEHPAHTSYEAMVCDIDLGSDIDVSKLPK